MKQTDPQFKLRLPSELKERLDAAASASNRSVTAEMVNRLSATFDIEEALEEVAPGCPVSQVPGLLRHMHEEHGDAVDNMEDVTRSIYAKRLEDNLDTSLMRLDLIQQLLSLLVMQNAFPDLVTEDHKAAALKLVEPLFGAGEPAELMSKIRTGVQAAAINKDFGT
jgi:hypothetical protein